MLLLLRGAHISASTIKHHFLVIQTTTNLPAVCRQGESLVLVDRTARNLSPGARASGLTRGMNNNNKFINFSRPIVERSFKSSVANPEP